MLNINIIIMHAINFADIFLYSCVILQYLQLHHLLSFLSTITFKQTTFNDAKKRRKKRKNTRIFVRFRFIADHSENHKSPWAYAIC